MPRRKVNRSVEEEEEYQRSKRERQAKWQAEKREAKRILSKKDSQFLSNIEFCSYITQTSSNFSKNIIIDFNPSTSHTTEVHSANETITTASQTNDTSTITNVCIIKNSNKVYKTINNNIQLFNVNDDIQIIQNVHNSIQILY